MKPDCQHEPNTHCIHSSERRSFRSCRRRWEWAFRQHIRPEVTPTPLEVGIAFHQAMESIYDPDTWDTTTDDEKLNTAIKIYRDTCEAQRARYLKVTRQTKLPPGEAYGDNYEERADLGEGMLTHYMREIHPSADKWFKPVAVEIPFTHPLKWSDTSFTRTIEGAVPGETMFCTNSPACGQKHDNPAWVTLNGRVDALLEDLAYGGYYVADWKTAAELIRNPEFLQLDDQITSYCAVLQGMFNLDVRGFMYAEFWKNYPQSPKELTRVVKGKQYSTDKRQPTTFYVTDAFLRANDESAYEAGFYDEYMEFLKSPEAPKFHQRFPIVQSDEKLNNVLDNVAQEASEMISSLTQTYPSPGKFNCSGCAYKAPCLGKFNGEDYNYTLRTSFA